MADFGLKISQPFADAQTAADKDLLFSSSWPSLPTAGSANIDVAAFDVGVINHGLGYPPLVIAWKISTGEASMLGFAEPPDVTNNYIILTDILGTGGSYHVKWYGIDITKERDYPLLSSQSVPTTYNPDYGIKIAKVGADIESDDMRDFILHSRCQSPLILSVVTQASAADYTTSGGVLINNAVKYTNPGGYVPWVFAYGSYDDPLTFYNGERRYTAAGVGSQAYPGLLIDDGNDTSFTTVQPGIASYASLIVLRDPLFASTDTEATY